MEDKVQEALSRVFDPCSVSAHAPLSVVDMGLVTKVAIDGGAVTITLKPTSPWCTMIGSILKGVEEQVAAVEGVSSVTAVIDQDQRWSEAEITPVGRERLEAARARARALRPVRPQQWKERAAALAKEA